MNIFDQDILIVIPSRFAASRFPGKPLVSITGADHITKPLIQHCWDAAMAAGLPADIVVATDDPRIFDVVAGFGGHCIMTSSSVRNGTERCAETIRKIRSKARLVINLQGDSPMVVSAHIKALIAHWQKTGAPVCSPYLCCDAGGMNKLMADIAEGRPGGVFVDTDATENAIGFSRQPPSFISPNQDPLKLHIGLYAYTPAALERYISMPPSTAELSLGLEQLRYLDNGFPIEMVEVTAAKISYADVNYPHDVAVVEHLLQA